MGFSLKRALAGAVAGAGTAVSELADLQIKEAAVARAREQEIEDKRMLMGEENDLLIQREQRVAEMKNAMLGEERGKVGEMVKTFAAEYKGKDITSPEGQRYLAGRFAEAGRTDLANTYEDNARAGLSARDAAENRRAQLGIAAQNSRDNRDSIRQRREELKAVQDEKLREKKNAAMFGQIRVLSDRVGTRGRDGKFIRDDTGLSVGNMIANFAVENLGETHTRATEVASDAMSKYSQLLEENNRRPLSERRDSNTLANGFVSQFAIALKEEKDALAKVKATASAPATAPATVSARGTNSLTREERIDLVPY